MLRSRTGENGVVIRSGGLKTIHRIDDKQGSRDAGVTWAELLKTTLARGLTPPVMTEFQDLSIGGTLSLGGLGGASHRFGAQVDHVLELEVVTGAGELLTVLSIATASCFIPSWRFWAKRINRASDQFRLVPAPTHVIVQNLVYLDLGSYLADALQTVQMRALTINSVASPLKREAVRTFRLEAGRFYSEPAKPDLADATAGLCYIEAMKPVTYTYWEYLNQRPAVVRPAKGWYSRTRHCTCSCPSPRSRGSLPACLRRRRVRRRSHPSFIRYISAEHA